MNIKSVLISGGGAYAGLYVYNNFVAGKFMADNSMVQIALLIASLGAGVAVANKIL